MFAHYLLAGVVSFFCCQSFLRSMFCFARIVDSL
nr:MAG TPA: hypothetical protein [Caudoviricetes sp.]